MEMMQDLSLTDDYEKDADEYLGGGTSELDLTDLLVLIAGQLREMGVQEDRLVALLHKCGEIGCGKPRALENLRRFLVKVLEFIGFKRQHEDEGLTYIPKGLCEQHPILKILQNWVNKYRGKLFGFDQGRKVYGLTSFYIELLELIGFERAMPRAEQWEVKFCLLLMYKEEFGHCNVKTKDENFCNLGFWVSRQRTSYRDKPSHERYKRLDEVGFVWQKISYPKIRRSAKSASVSKPIPAKRSPSTRPWRK